jgi:hypothetical protein
MSEPQLAAQNMVEHIHCVNAIRSALQKKPIEQRPSSKQA